MNTNKPERQANNKGLVQQILNDIRAGCGGSWDISITSLTPNGKERETSGSVYKVDLKEKRIYINEAQAIENVPFSEITSYKWK